MGCRTACVTAEFGCCCGLICSTWLCFSLGMGMYALYLTLVCTLDFRRVTTGSLPCVLAETLGVAFELMSAWIRSLGY